MRSILGYLKGAWKTVCVIFALLIVQAYCDLTLPTYMSSIVDVGIQQNGIADAVPEKIRGQSLEALKLFLTDEEVRQATAAYTLQQDGSYVLKSYVEGEQREALSRAFARPMVLLSQAAEQHADVGQMYAAIESGAVSREQFARMREQALAQLDNVPESTLQQMAVQFVAAEYEAMGTDLGAFRSRYLLTTGGKMLGLAALGVLAAIVVGLLASRIGSGIGRDLRGSMFERVLAFSSTEMNRFSTASLITRCTNDIQQVQMVIVILLRMVLFAPICAVGGILKVVNTHTGMGWIIFVAVAVILAVLGTLISLSMPKFRMMQSLVDRMNLISREILTGIMPIRAFSREKHEEERFSQANDALMRTQLFTNRVMTFMMPLMMLTMNGITVMIVWFGSKGVDAGQLQVGDMMAFINYTMMIVMSFMMMTMVSIMLPRAGVAADRINEVLHTVPSIADPKTPVEHTWRGRICFEDVSFRYPGADRDALSHISFTAEPGKTTAIIGSTGCGKSTLLHLIARFFDVTSGRVTLDGVDVRDIRQAELRDQLGFVPQKGVLFSGSIASNLKFAGKQVTDEEMKRAADIAQATEFIDSKVDGYRSAIAQGGSNVSGGQKQRLSIARAIAKHPKVYLFDDSFSALDYKTDAALRRALAGSVSEATVFIVAQRISTILHADQIIVLNEGCIEGIGTHEQLLHSCRTYREIAESQLSERELEGGGAR
ncbi:MAG TPA: ABC transporter [Clostridiales bacterium]|nr:ABC transporter [Clostridiales bacterium]